MSVLPEYFDPNQFVQPDYDSHFTIKRPYTTFSKSMILKFEEYNVRKSNIYIIIKSDEPQSSMCSFRQNLEHLYQPLRSKRS